MSVFPARVKNIRDALLRPVSLARNISLLWLVVDLFSHVPESAPTAAARASTATVASVVTYLEDVVINVLRLVQCAPTTDLFDLLLQNKVLSDLVTVADVTLPLLAHALGLQGVSAHVQVLIFGIFQLAGAPTCVGFSSSCNAVRAVGRA